MPRTRLRDPDGRLRVLIVDRHEVYRAACAALLRTEGLDVVDARPGHHIVGLARALEPDIVLIDVAPTAERLHETVRQLGSLPSAPTIVLISSAGRDRLDSSLAGCPFIAKGDVSAREIRRAVLDGSDEPDAPAESE
jgi:DNA-binding NarL/FixJ family response regulator